MVDATIVPVCRFSFHSPYSINFFTTPSCLIYAKGLLRDAATWNPTNHVLFSRQDDLMRTCIHIHQEYDCHNLALPSNCTLRTPDADIIAVCRQIAGDGGNCLPVRARIRVSHTVCRVKQTAAAVAGKRVLHSCLSGCV
jgi:hypothetical protein